MLLKIGLLPTKLVKSQLRYLYPVLQLGGSKRTSMRNKKLFVAVEETHFTKVKRKMETRNVRDINMYRKHPRKRISLSP